MRGPPLFTAPSQFVERALKLVLLFLKPFVISVSRNVNWRRDADERAREGLWHLESVPALLCFPESRRSDRERQDRIAGLLCHQDRAQLGDGTRNLLPIRRKTRRQ